ncbi:hypothetical protein [Sinorhizobium meliloti]|nr:hypothetical protein [Sinorhizobium meliloti]
MNGSTNAVIVTGASNGLQQAGVILINTSDLGRTSHPREAIRSKR